MRTQISSVRSVNNHIERAENPRYCRKLTASIPDNVDAIRDSVRMCPKMFLL